MNAQGVVARWETPNGKHWVELHGHPLHGSDVPHSYSYRAPGCGGNLGVITEAQALAEVERRIADGYFTPDANKRLPVRVAMGGR